MFPTLSFLSLIAKAHLVLIRCVCVFVCVCARAPLLCSLSAWPSVEVVLSLLLPPTALQHKAYTLNFRVIVRVLW